MLELVVHYYPYVQALLFLRNNAITVMKNGGQKQHNEWVKTLWHVAAAAVEKALALPSPHPVFSSPQQADVPSCLVFLPRLAEGAPLNWDQAD